MGPLGPFPPAPHLAVAVSGGPHSLALALLAHTWTRTRHGRLLALIADHRLRPDSTTEAATVATTLRTRGIESRILTLSIPPGSALQARARTARLAALLAACRAAATPWLLLGHHAGDQAETLLARALHGSAAQGLAGIAPVRATAHALLLRPLLAIPPERLEAIVAAAALTPIRDPGNANPHQSRARLRAALAGPHHAAAAAALLAAHPPLAAARKDLAAAIAIRLAASTRLHPTGHADIDPTALGRDSVAEATLATLVHAIGGNPFSPSPAAAAHLIATGRGTLAGTWLRPSPHGWRLLREPNATAPPSPATQGAVWDNRFRLTAPGDPTCTIGALGPAPAIVRTQRLPAAIVATLPAIRRHGALIAIPILDHPDPTTCAPFAMHFSPLAGPITAQ